MIEKTESKKFKRWSRLVLLILGFVLFFLGQRATRLQFDYDFEKFFPQEDEGLEFFKEYREIFENDNDFILIGLRNKRGLFRTNFLQRVDAFTDSLRTLPHLREVISPLEMQYYELNPMRMGGGFNPFFHPGDPEKYKSDSIRLATTSQPISEMVNLNNKSLVILLKNEQLISKKKSDELANELSQLVESQSFDEIHIIGKIIGQLEYIEVMKKEFLTFMVISILVLIIFLIVTYRSMWGVFVPLATVLLAVVGSLGIMEISGTPLNIMTTLLPVIMLVVGMSDVVHLVSKYLEEVRYGRSKVIALTNMLKKVGVATLLTSLTTALGFITLVGVNMEPVRDFGIFTAVGVIIAFVLSIFFIPSIFMLIKKPKIINAKRIQNGWERGLGSLFIWLCRNRKKVLFAYLIITVISFWGASRIKFDYFLMQDLSEDQPLMQELRYFQNYYGGIRPFEMAIIPKNGFSMNDFEVIREVDILEDYLDSVYGVNQMISPTVPYKYINQALRNDKQAFFKVPENPKRFNYLRKKLESFESRQEWQQIISEDGSMGRVFGRMVDPGSREMLQRNAALKKFFQDNIDNSVIAYKLTGTPVIVDKSGRYVSRNVIIGLLIAFGLIGLSMGILFKSVKMAFLSLVPNIFPILLTAGFIGFVGIDLNITTSIVFTIAFGIAVDDTIHFLSRYRQEMKMGKSRLWGLRRTFISTGKAIVVTSIILLGGFGSLVFSNFLSTFYIGLFVSMTLLFAVVTDLSLLPMLLLGGKKSRSKTTV